MYIRKGEVTMSKTATTMTIDEVVDEIAKTMKELDGVMIEDLANQYLEGDFDYQGDGIFIRINA